MRANSLIVGSGSQADPTGLRLRLIRRMALGLALIGLMLAGPVPATTPYRLVLMPAEMDGDLSGGAGMDVWRDRLTLLKRLVGDGLVEQNLYQLVDTAPAAEYFEQLEQRAGVYDCTPCATGAATRLGADRVLNLRVFRVSALILTLHVYLRDQSGELRYLRALDFRGDNERAWRRAAHYLVRDMAGMPASRR